MSGSKRTTITSRMSSSTLRGSKHSASSSMRSTTWMRGVMSTRCAWLPTSHWSRVAPQASTDRCRSSRRYDPRLYMQTQTHIHRAKPSATTARPKTRPNPFLSARFEAHPPSLSTASSGANPTSLLRSLVPQKMKRQSSTTAKTPTTQTRLQICRKRRMR